MNRLVTAFACLAACVTLSLGGCDTVSDIVDDLNRTGSGDAGDTTSAGDTSAGTDTGQVAPLNASVTMTAQIRSVVANGQLFVEGNFTWNASGVSGLRVDIQVKNSVAYPDWTNLLSNQEAVDVGTAGLNGPDTRFNFRAVAYLASDPSNVVISDIITIQ